MKNIIKNAIILTLITLVAGTALAAVYSITKEPIEKSAELAQESAYEKVFSNADSFKKIDLDDYSDENSATVSDVRSALDKEGNVIGYVLTTSCKGYGGQIEVAMGVDTQKEETLTSISILSADDETPGLGAKCKDEEFYGQFKDISSINLSYDKDVDAITGATYSSNGVLNAVNAGLAYVANFIKEGK